MKRKRVLTETDKRVIRRDADTVLRSRLSDDAGDWEKTGRRLLALWELVNRHPELAEDEELARDLEMLAVRADMLASVVNLIHLQDLTTGLLPDVPDHNPELRQRGQHIVSGGSFTYVAYDHNNQVLYVGVTSNLFARMAAHCSRSPWWDLAVRLTWEEWPDRQTAERQEIRLIRRYRPPYNTAGNPGGFRGRRR